MPRNSSLKSDMKQDLKGKMLNIKVENPEIILPKDVNLGGEHVEV